MSLEKQLADEKYNLERHGKVDKPVCRKNLYLVYKLIVDNTPMCCLGGTSCAYLNRDGDFSFCTAKNKKVD